MRTLQDTNIAFTKHQRAKKLYIQLGGALNIDNSTKLLAEKGSKKRCVPNEGENGGPSKKTTAASRQYGNCHATGHNARTCDKVEEIDTELESDKK